MAAHRSFVIYADGACKGNPGTGGWGYRVEEGGALVEESHGGEAETTNNRMELMAVIQSLANLPAGSKVRVCSDSQYVIKGIKEWIHGWKKNGWRTADKKPVKNDALWKTLDAQRSKFDITWEWVKGHAGHPGNERADELANMGVEAILATLVQTKKRAY